MKNATVTELERQVIQNIINSEYMDADGEMIISWGVWSFSATHSRKDLAGALGSLEQKGLVGFDHTDEMPVCYLTESGYLWAKENNLCN
jgi:hypothetical protein